MGGGGAGVLPSRPEGGSPASWVLVLASKVSARLSAPGKGQAEPGSAGLGVRPPCLQLPGPVAGGPACERSVTLSPPLQLLFLPLFLKSEGAWGKGGRKGSPSPGPRRAVWGDRLTLCFGARVVLLLSNFTPSLDTRSLSYNIHGEWPSKAAEGMKCLAH